MAKKRNYENEYKSYHSKPEQIKRRASRNAARAAMVKAGKARKGDGMDVDHANSDPLNNSTKNLRMQTKRANRSFARTKTAREK